MFHCVEYSHLYIGTIRIGALGSVTCNSSIYNTRKTLRSSKMACFDVDGGRYTYPESRIRAKTFAYLHLQPNQGTKLFVSPECRISRDLFRNSGYKLVRDKEDAAYIVIPALKKDSFYMAADLIVKDLDTDSLYLFSVDDRAQEPELVMDRIKSRLSSYNLLYYHDKLTPHCVCSFLPKCQVYKDILTDADITQKKSYIFETAIEFSCPIKINPETLDVWRHSSDLELLAKSICNSDWQKYPFTLLMFLVSEQYNIFYGFGGNNFKLVTEQIGYDYNKSIDEMVADRTITPEDWNMFQSYIMNRLGIEASGGYVDSDKFNSIPYSYQKLLRSKMAVVPMNITQEISYENIRSLLLS